MKEQQSYYDKVWAERNKQGEQIDIGWAYEKGRIDATLLKLVKDSLSDFAQILEIGIGKGDLASKLSQIEHSRISYLGIDISNEGVRIARRKLDSRFRFLVADGTSLPLESQQFDIVICSEVIEHIIKREKLLAEISRVLKAGGYLLMTTPNPKALTYMLPRMINKVYRFHYGSSQPVNELIERKELAGMLKSQGFEILGHTGLIYRPYTVDRLEGYLRRPLMIARWISEYLERKNLFSSLGLYLVVWARKGIA